MKTPTDERLREIEQEIRKLVQEAIPPMAEMDLVTLESSPNTAAPATKVSSVEAKRVIVTGTNGVSLTIFRGLKFNAAAYRGKAAICDDDIDKRYRHYLSPPKIRLGK